MDGDAREVEVWTPGDLLPRIESERPGWRSRGIEELFVLTLDALFRAI